MADYFAIRGTVKRFVQTSSLAAVAHGPPADYTGDRSEYMANKLFTEDDWCDDAAPAMIPKDRNVAYSAAKKAAEYALYDLAEESGQFEACCIHPTHVLGPLKAANNDDYLSWQWAFKEMMAGAPMQRSPGGRMLWNIVDVRDC